MFYLVKYSMVKFEHVIKPLSIIFSVSDAERITTAGLHLELNFPEAVNQYSDPHLR
jgi:hypothetical protein